MRIERLDQGDYTYAVYYTDAEGCHIKFLCYATDELDAYQQAQQNIERSKVYGRPYERGN